MRKNRKGLWALLALLLLTLCACGAHAPHTAAQMPSPSGETPGGTFESGPLPQSESGEAGSFAQTPSPPATPSGSGGSEASASSLPDLSSLNFRLAAWENVEWEEYSSTFFTLRIPKGWNVQWQGDANQMQWMATSPDNTVGISNMDHAYACKDARAQSFLGFAVSMTGGTVREFFEATFQNSTEYFTVMNSCVPENADLIRQVRPYDTVRDYQSLYAVFKDENVEGEGIYSAVVMESQDVWFNGLNYGVWEVNCILTQWAPVGELVNWAPVIAQIAQSFKYTDYYIRQWQQIAQSVLTPYNALSDTDSVAKAFEERSEADDILREKRSDMIGEYERVYDTESGRIYRAYNGFLDDVGDQSRFTPITDSQYTEGYAGWIEK